jgi:hypothetical protein
MMSLSYVALMLETIKLYSSCKIHLTFYDNNKQPILTVCHKSDYYEITMFPTLINKKCNTVECVIEAIDIEF